MKKKRRLLVIAGFAVMLAAPSGFAARAAEGDQSGWQAEGDQWVYLKYDGSRETDTWIKDSGLWYYVDSEGYMVRDEIIEEGQDFYYVDDNGVRVANRWVSRRNEGSECEQEVDTLWYYFGKNGKAMRDEGRAVKIKEGAAEFSYFFDRDGHMLSGWKEITNQNGDTNIYYLGNENQGHIHKMWQYLEPDDKVLNLEGHEYDALEMFYFGYDGKMTRSGESHLEGEYFLFDENGVMLKGWYPGIGAPSADFALNRYYDEKTGKRGSGWIYSCDPDDKGGDPHWFYCDKKTGLIYNEGGKDSQGSLAWKTIDGKIYFFDEKGHMITGLIATDGTDLGENLFVEEDFAGVTGDIGKSTHLKTAGIYYLSQDRNSLGQMQKGKRLHLKDSYEDFYYELDSTGRAYQNALVDGCIFGNDGALIHAEQGMDILPVDTPIYKKEDYVKGHLKDSAVPVIEAGARVIVSSSGKVKKDGTVKIEGTVYHVKNYVVDSVE